jgi:hypothetical protein
MHSRTRAVRDHHLERRHAALAVGARHEALRDHRLEDRRELEAHLLLLVRREHRDDAVDRLGRVEGVQRREHEVAGLGRGERRLDRLEVAHLAHEDDVGSWRSAARSALAKVCVSTPISRWFTIERRRGSGTRSGPRSS